jgi:hypothetical protein
MKDCICLTTKRWLFYHLTYCPWRLRVEAEMCRGR